jgi:hypothetical protein
MFIINKNSHKETFKLVDGHCVYSYPSIFPFTNDCNPMYKINDDKIKHSCGASLTVLLEFVKRVNYKTVILYGIDLNSAYFWMDKDNVHCKTNGNQNPNEPHTTVKKGIMNFIIGFNEHHMKPYGNEIFVGYEDTLLYGELRHFTI